MEKKQKRVRCHCCGDAITYQHRIRTAEMLEVIITQNNLKIGSNVCCHHFNEHSHVDGDGKPRRLS